MQKKPSLTIFFPCYNDSKTIGGLVRKAFEIVKKITPDHEVIVIDDGSTDSSRQLLKTLAKKYKKLKLVFHRKNQGYGGALKSGFAEASKDLVFYTDGDGQYDISEMPLLLNLMTQDTDFVNGMKISRHDPSYRIFLGNLYSFVSRWAFWLPVSDVDCDFRLIKHSLINKLTLKSNSGSICVELVKKAQRKGARFRQVSIHHYQRKHGQSQFFRPERIASTMKELAGIWVQLMIIDRFLKHGNL